MECISVKKWLQIMKSYNQNVRTFMMANILIQIGMGVFSVMYNLYIRELGLPEAVNGSVISVTSLATAIMLVPSGILSDRLGRKRVLITGTALTALMLFGRSIVTAEQPMLILGFATGVVWALAQVTGVPFLAENSRPAERMQLFSIHFALVTVANVVGSLLGGMIADFALMLGAGDVASIQISLLTGVLCFVAGLLPLFSLKPVDTRAREEEKGQNEEVHTVADFKTNVKVIILFSIANLLIGTGSGLVIPYLNLYFANRFDATNSYIGFILALGSAMTAVAMLIGPRLVRRVGKVRALIIFQIASIPFLFLTAYTNLLFLASIGFLLRQALMNAGNPIQSAIAMDVVHDKYKGLANSVNQMVFNIGWATMGIPAAWLVTKYGAYWGYAYAFSITGILYLIASIYFYFIFGKHYVKKREKTKGLATTV